MTTRFDPGEPRPRITPKRGGEPWTKDDFVPVPSTEGAFYHPTHYGRIVYTHERDEIIRGERRGGFRRLLDRLGLKQTRLRDLNGH